LEGVPVNAARVMDPEDLFPGRPIEPLDALRRQDLDPMSVDELHARIAALEAEIARVRAHLDAGAARRQAAEALFRR